MTVNNLDAIADKLFNKIKSTTPNCKIGDKDGNVINKPTDARFFDFDFSDNGKAIGQVTCSLDNEKLTVIYNDNLVGDADELTRQNWYEFLRGLRQFSRSKLLGFDVRNITKDANKIRDYKFLSANMVAETIDLKNYIENL